MSFNINGIEAFFPTGTICPYGGSNDPSGWVICDGVSRPNENNKYNNLKNMGFGTITVNDYTPPDLTSGTMIGKSSSTTLLNYVGNNNNNITLLHTQMPSHYHSSSINAHTATHTHTYDDEKMDDSVEGYGLPRQDGVDGSLHNVDENRTTAAVSHNHPNSLTNSAGSGTAFSILNACYIVNWIAKL